MGLIDMPDNIVVMPDTSIPIDSEVRDDLRAEKEGSETYTDVIQRLLQNNE